MLSEILHDIKRDPATLFQEGLLRTCFSPLSLKQTSWKSGKRFKEVLIYNAKDKKWARDLIKILEGRMDRVIANVVIYSYKAEYIDEGLRPSGRVACLPHGTQDAWDWKDTG